MALVGFLAEIAGAIMLLLFSVRLVRTGVERAHGARFKQLLARQGSAVRAAFAGTFLAVVMQSSAAAAVLTAGFTAAGYLQFPAALAVVLGGDLGSALIVLLLSFPVEWLVAPLLAVGGWLAVKCEGLVLRQYGRIITGVALILISLGLLRQAVEPMHGSGFLEVLTSYLERDLVTAFIVGAAMAFGMHSSIAAMLVIAAFVHQDAIGFTAGLALMLGANFGSGFIPIWMARGMMGRARQVLAVNLFSRAGLSLAALPFLVAFRTEIPAAPEDPVQWLVLSHVGFNLALVAAALPFVGVADRMTTRLAKAAMNGLPPTADVEPRSSHLDEDVLADPKLALTGLQLELLGMLSLVEAMFAPAVEFYGDRDARRIDAVVAKDSEVNDCLARIREFVSRIPAENYRKADMRSARDMLDYAIRLESAGDVVSGKMSDLAREMLQEKMVFSPEGLRELAAMHGAVESNFRLASNVLMSKDVQSARLLSHRKTDIKRAERRSRKRHFKRLQAGRPECFETSDIHLQTLRALREISGHIAAVAYPVLYESGQLLETRLIENLPSATDELRT